LFSDLFGRRVAAMKTLTVTEAKTRLNELIEDATRTHEQVTITKHGHPSVVMLSAEDFESLQETVYWLSQPGIRASLDESDADVASGNTVGSDELRERLGLPPR
jgi:antitoxin YefM